MTIIPYSQQSLIQLKVRRWSLLPVSAILHQHNFCLANHWTRSQAVSILMHVSSSPLRHCKAETTQDAEAFLYFIGKDEWPPNSLDLNPMDYCRWDAMLKCYQRYTPNIAKLNTTLLTVWNNCHCCSLIRQLYHFSMSACLPVGTAVSPEKLTESMPFMGTWALGTIYYSMVHIGFMWRMRLNVLLE